MAEEKNNKLLIAVLQGDDYENVVHDLTGNGFYVTQLNSVGGFLKRRSMTIMVGLPESRLEEAKAILQKRAGVRVETVYQNQLMTDATADLSPVMPMSVNRGGVVMFVLDIEQMERF